MAQGGGGLLPERVPGELDQDQRELVRRAYTAYAGRLRARAVAMRAGRPVVAGFADDVCQESFRRLIGMLVRGRVLPGAEPWPILLGIAQRVCRELAYQARVHARHAERAAKARRLLEPSTESLVQRSEEMDRLRSCIDGLGPELRETARLRLLTTHPDGSRLRLDEVASLLGITEGTAKSRMSTVRRHLAEALESPRDPGRARGARPGGSRASPPSVDEGRSERPVSVESCRPGKGTR